MEANKKNAVQPRTPEQVNQVTNIYKKWRWGVRQHILSKLLDDDRPQSFDNEVRLSVRNYNLLDDIEQSSWAAITAGIHTFDQSKSSLANWLYTIAEREVWKHYNPDKNDASDKDIAPEELAARAQKPIVGNYEG